MGQQVDAVRHHRYAGGDEGGLPSAPAGRAQVVYILDMVRALEREMLKRIHAQGLNMTPQIIVITRLIPEALGAPRRPAPPPGPAGQGRGCRLVHGAVCMERLPMRAPRGPFEIEGVCTLPNPVFAA